MGHHAHNEGSLREESSQGRANSSGFLFQETPSPLRQFESLNESFGLKEEDVRERGHLESQGRGVCWQFECSLAKLKQLAVAEHRLVQHGVENHPLEEEGRVQLKQPDVALSANSFCAAWKKVSFEKQVW